LNVSYLVKFKKYPICAALLKYGYSNFSLEILEYCGRENVIEREQYYIDSFKPEYNILKKAGSSLGYKHSEETLSKLSASLKALGRLGKNHPMYGKNHTEEARAKIAAGNKGKIRT
jgi:group I intron endonuclease